MYNNLTQQTPYMYGYGMQGYQRMMPAQNQEVAPAVANAQPYSASIMMPQMNYIKGRPVVSIDEARASQIDLDGSLYVFPDLGNKKIYTKQINMDGTAAFNVFELSGAHEEASSTPTYVTKDELDEILASFKAGLLQERQHESGAAPVKAQINKTSFNL